MRVNKCDSCGSIESAENRVVNRFTIRYAQKCRCEDEETGRRYEEWEDRREQFDLCEKCAKEIYKQITGRYPAQICIK